MCRGWRSQPQKSILGQGGRKLDSVGYHHPRKNQKGPRSEVRGEAEVRGRLIAFIILSFNYFYTFLKHLQNSWQNFAIISDE